MEELVQTFQEVLDRVSAPSSNNNNNLRPPKFNGHQTDDIELWYDQFKRYADHTSLDEAKRLTCIKALLDG